MENSDVEDAYLIHNHTDDVVKEIWFEIEEFRRNLKIYDSNNKELPYFTKSEIYNLRIKDFAKVDMANRNLIFIPLQEENYMSPQEYRNITLYYQDVNRNRVNSAFSLTDLLLGKREFLYPATFYVDNTDSISVFFQVPKGISVKFGAIAWSSADSSNEMIPFDPDELHLHNEDTTISFTLSKRVKTQLSQEKDGKVSVDRIDLFLIIEPNKSFFAVNFALELFISILTYAILPVSVANLFLHTQNLTEVTSLISADFVSVLTLALLPFKNSLLLIRRFVILISVTLSIILLFVLAYIIYPDELLLATHLSIVKTYLHYIAIGLIVIGSLLLAIGSVKAYLARPIDIVIENDPNEKP